MLVLGIDPGTATTGYGLVRKTTNGPEIVHFGWIMTDKETDSNTRLAEIYKKLNGILKEFRPDVLATERLFFYLNARTAINVAQAQGVIMLSAAKHNIPLIEYTPAQVKLTVSGSGRADKTLMKRAVRKILSVRSPNKKRAHFDDVCDALALALCHIEKTNIK